MSTERERARNRAKQRRFHQRHPSYCKKRNREYAKRRNLYEVQAWFTHRVFELYDPRDDDRLPLVVGCCKATIDPVWSVLWFLKDYSRSCWAGWLRDLDKHGLRPACRLDWAPRSNLPHRCARQMVKFRVAQINKRLTGNKDKSPAWLLRPIIRFRCGQGSNHHARRSAQPVGCLTRNGHIIRFNSLSEASHATRINTATLGNLVDELELWNGWRWWDD